MATVNDELQKVLNSIARVASGHYLDANDRKEALYYVIETAQRELDRQAGREVKPMYPNLPEG